MSKRFDYIKYDDLSIKNQDLFKMQCMNLEADIQRLIKSPVEKHLALVKLEEFYMWIGKAIKKDQTLRTEIYDVEKSTSVL